MSDWWESIRALPWKDWASAIITAGGTLLVAVLTIGFRSREGQRAREEARLAREREEDAREDATERANELAQTQDWTERFKALMDGYEGRIRDLTDSMAEMRAELRDVRRQLDEHRRICQGCPNYGQRMRDFAG